MATTIRPKLGRSMVLVCGLMLVLTTGGCASRSGGQLTDYYEAMGEVRVISDNTSARWNGLVKRRRDGEVVDANEALDVGAALFASMRAAAFMMGDAGLQRSSLSDDTRTAVKEAKDAFAELQARDAKRR